MIDSPPKPETQVGRFLSQFARKATDWTGSTPAFILATSVVIVWAATGPVFRYSDTWQLVINTGTTIVTFLMVFLIQRSQNRDAIAVQLKLNELIAAVKGASNRLIAIEELTDDEIRKLHENYVRLAEMAKADVMPGRFRRGAVTPRGRTAGGRSASASGVHAAGW